MRAPDRAEAQTAGEEHTPINENLLLDRAVLLTLAVGGLRDPGGGGCEEWLRRALATYNTALYERPGTSGLEFVLGRFGEISDKLVALPSGVNAAAHPEDADLVQTTLERACVSPSILLAHKRYQGRLNPASYRSCEEDLGYIIKLLCLARQWRADLLTWPPRRDLFLGLFTEAAVDVTPTGVDGGLYGFVSSPCRFPYVPPTPGQTGREDAVRYAVFTHESLAAGPAQESKPVMTPSRNNPAPTSAGRATPRDVGHDATGDEAVADAPVDFAIITAIRVEREAVCRAFGLADEHRIRKGARVYWRGRLPLKGGGAYEIVVTQSPDMANVDAALLTADTLHHWEPGAALMVGIAASTSDEVGLGDVVVGSDVYYYERGKMKPEGRKPEPKQYPADATLWANAQTLPKWTSRINARRPDGTKSRPNVHFGVIASGEKVIADAEMRDQVASAHRKIVAIEMEGYGFSRAVWQSFDRVRHLVIRSICDDGSPAKDDKWHTYAAAAAASFAKHFLADGPVAPRNDARPVPTEIPASGSPTARVTESGGGSFREQRLRHELTELQGMFNLISRKIDALQRALVIETGAAVQFQLREQLGEEKTRLADISARIGEIERELQ